MAVLIVISMHNIKFEFKSLKMYPKNYGFKE